jgi:phospholipid/cholesterol/gamma-HCH transport system ATP-binding protein
VTDDVVIRFDRITKSFGRQKILEGLSFEVGRGRAFCLLGRSGSGKSLTLKHMIGLIKPDSGEIYLEGEPITDLKSSELPRVRKRMGFMFQYSALFDSITVGENVAFPLRWHTELPESEIRQRATELLDQVGLAADYDRMPTDLSGGMRKRVGLARALALDPPILLVDEPSSGLDPITSAEIDDLLIRLKQHRGTTMVIVTHNIPSAQRIGDELALLEGGKIVESGTAVELRESDHDTVRRFMGAAGGT